MCLLPKNKSVLVQSLRTRLENRQNSLFKLEMPIGHAIRRAISRLERAHRIAKPAAVVAYFKLLLNGWPTAKRMASLKDNTNSKLCLFCGCGVDCIEHFAFCSFVKHVFVSLHAPLSRHWPICSFYLLDDACTCDSTLRIRIKGHGLLFHMHAALRHHPVSAAPLNPYDLLTAALHLR